MNDVEYIRGLAEEAERDGLYETAINCREIADRIEKMQDSSPKTIDLYSITLGMTVWTAIGITVRTIDNYVLTEWVVCSINVNGSLSLKRKSDDWFMRTDSNLCYSICRTLEAAIKAKQNK